MTIVIFVVVTAAVLTIAAIAVGLTAARMSDDPPASLFEFDEAVEFIATALPADLSARLSYGDVRAVLAAHIDELRRDDFVGDDVVFVDESMVPRLLRRTDVAARSLDARELGAILDAEAEYLEAIGAVADEARAGVMPNRTSRSGDGDPTPRDAAS